LRPGQAVTEGDIALADAMPGPGVQLAAAMDARIVVAIDDRDLP